MKRQRGLKSDRSNEVNLIEQRAEQSECGSLEVFYVGSVLPDTAEFRSKVFSSAGCMFQRNLLAAAKSAGLPVREAISYRHAAAFPRGRKVWLRGGHIELESGIRVRLLGSPNVPVLKEAWLSVSAAMAILGWGRRVAREKKKAILIYNLSVPSGVVCLAAARLAGARLVAIVADINEPGQTVSNGWRQRLDYGLQRWVIPRCDGHLSLAEQIMADFAPGRSFLRVEGGVLAEWGDRSVSAQQARVPGEFAIAFAGKLCTANGVELLLGAFELIKGEQYRLVIAGSGPLEELVREAAARDKRVRYLGFVSHDEVLALYGRANVLVNLRLTREVSTRYFFPSKFTECLGSGTPVVSTCTGHVEKECGELVYLLKDETPEGLARTLRQVAEEPESVRESRGTAARSFVRMHKTWDAQGRQVVNYVRGVCGLSRIGST